MEINCQCMYIFHSETIIITQMSHINHRHYFITVICMTYEFVSKRIASYT